MSENKQILIGEIKGAHGVKGLVRVFVFVDDISLFKKLTSHTITLKNKHKPNIWLATIDTITDKDAADALRGTKLYINHDDRPEAADDEIYFTDLVGMECIDTNGNIIGIVSAVNNFGAGDLLDIKPPSGQNFFLSYDDKTVIGITDKITVVMPEVL